jgi:hypothetical protein
MKKIILSLTILVIIIAMCTPFVQANASTEEKNNEKFKTFSVIATEPFKQTMLGEHEYIPSIDNINRLVITIPETLTTCTITVNGQTYTLGKDFAYSGILTYTFNKPLFENPKTGLLYPSSANAAHSIVDYTYDFSAYSGGIEGTLNMKAEFTAGGRFINSISGTGDLQNVQVKAIAIPPIVASGVVNIEHQGIVIGWPE